ncbi:MAG TPA: alpha/beta hydrolase, partial [Halanaerobiales bacterium]|nr:alpha/beta hydrolase [Halanaerobiales bacterium]
SLGGLVCLKAYSSDITTMVLSGPITDSMNYDWEKFYSQEKMDELKKQGYLTIGSEEVGIRKVSQEMLEAFSEINQEKLLEDVKCPVLIIHGDRGEEEKQLLERSKKALRILPNDSKLKVVEDAAHGIRDQYHIVVELTVDWFFNNFSLE